MVTSIVKFVKTILGSNSGSKQVEAELVFPVASEALTTTVGDEDLAVVPGVSESEGCSTAGGCATCPFMKMNDLDALTDLITMINDANYFNNSKKSSSSNNNNNKRSKNLSELSLRGHLPPQRLQNKKVNGINAVELGVLPIMHMRHFMAKKVLSDELVDSIHAANKQKKVPDHQVVKNLFFILPSRICLQPIK